MQIDTCQEYYVNPEKVGRLQGRVDEVRGMAEIFKAMGDETRTRILYLLSLEELCVCDLSSLLGASMSSVSHHLRLLRSLKLVEPRRVGKMVYYSLKDGNIAHLINDMKEHMTHSDGGDDIEEEV